MAINSVQNARLCEQSSVSPLSAKRKELNELVHHLKVIEGRAANEKDPSIRASWEDQAVAVRALIGGLERGRLVKAGVGD